MSAKQKAIVALLIILIISVFSILYIISNPNPYIRYQTQYRFDQIGQCRQDGNSFDDCLTKVAS